MSATRLFGLVLAAGLVGFGGVEGFAAPAIRRAEAPRASEDERDVQHARAVDAWRAARDVSALHALLRDLAGRSDGRARVVELGLGRDARPMLALELGPAAAPGVAVLPALVAREADAGTLPGIAERDALLDVARAFVLGSGPGGPLEAALLAHRLVFVVGARPDLLAPVLPAERPDAARNFPVDGDLAVRSGGGVIPLRSAESRALATWMHGDPALFAAVLLGAPPIAPEALATGDEAADAELARLVASMRVVDAAGGLAADDTPVYGGFARHARLRAGLAVVAWPLGEGVGRERVHVAALLDVLFAAPRLELLLDPRTRPVGSDLWQLDLVLANVGALGTGSAVHERERRPRGVILAAPRAELVVAAARVAGGAFEVVDVETLPDGLGLRLGDLPAGARVELRLFVRAAREGPVELTAVGTRAIAARTFGALARER